MHRCAMMRCMQNCNGRLTASRNVREAAAEHSITCRAQNTARCVATVGAHESQTMDAVSCSCTLYCSASDKPWWVNTSVDDAGNAHIWIDASTFVMVDSDLDDGCAVLGEDCIRRRCPGWGTSHGSDTS